MLCPLGGGCYALLEEDVMPRKFGIIEASLSELKHTSGPQIGHDHDQGEIECDKEFLRS